MVLLAPTTTALQTMLEVCRAYAGPHDIVYSIHHNENSMYAGPAKAITGSVLNKSQARKCGTLLGREFRYLGHVITADFRDDKDIEKQFKRQNSVGNMLVRKYALGCSLYL